MYLSLKSAGVSKVCRPSENLQVLSTEVVGGTVISEYKKQIQRQR